MAVYNISDLHLGHENILGLRTQFKDIDEHDSFITNNILTTCCKRDTLFILGDICFKNDSFHHMIEIAKNLENLYLVLGNHDFERTHSPTIKDYLSLENSGCKVNVFGIKKYKKKAWLSHAPIHPLELAGKINIHGHTHDINIDDSRYFNVSCENINFTPINMERILN